MQSIGALVLLFVITVSNPYSFATDAGPGKECVNTLAKFSPGAAAFIKDVKKRKSAKVEAADSIARIAAQSRSIKQKLPTSSIDQANNFQSRVDINLKSLLQENGVSLSKNAYNIIDTFAVNKNLNRAVLLPHKSTNRFYAGSIMVTRIDENGKIEFLNWLVKPSGQFATFSQPEFIGDSNILRVTKESINQTTDIHFYDLANEKKELNSLSEILNLSFTKTIAFSDTVYLVEVAKTHEIIIFEYDPRNEKAQIFHKAQPSNNQTIQEIVNKRHHISAEVVNNVLKLITPEMTVAIDPARNMIVPNRIKDTLDTEVLYSPEADLTSRPDLALSASVRNYTVGISPMVESENISINGTINLVIIPKN